mmetsp:Transcript_70266/g.114150  ORF Transcript_70266/g.114150 Transcript_70266/m.114150 type:complete len:262 (-) Transcript_70266:208-993(-)
MWRNGPCLGPNSTVRTVGKSMLCIHLQLIEFKRCERVHKKLKRFHRVHTIARDVEHDAAIRQVGPVPYHHGRNSAAALATHLSINIGVEAHLHKGLHTAKRAGFAEGRDYNVRSPSVQQICLVAVQLRLIFPLVEPLHRSLLHEEHRRHAACRSLVDAQRLRGCGIESWLECQDNPTRLVLRDLTSHCPRQAPVIAPKQFSAQASRYPALEFNATSRRRRHCHCLRHWHELCNGCWPQHVTLRGRCGIALSQKRSHHHHHK